MSKVIKVDETLVKQIEALQYEVESRKDVIVSMLSTSYMTEKEQFKAYQEEYKNYFIQYNKAKQVMLETCSVPNNVAWNLNFATCELTVG